MNDYLGAVAKKLREDIGWSQRETAAALGISPVHLCNLEGGKANFNDRLLGRYRELWDVDLYVIAWCEYGNTENFPQPLKIACHRLTRLWKSHIAKQIKRWKEPTP